MIDLSQGLWILKVTSFNAIPDLIKWRDKNGII
jgi:hypothetical protein